MLRAGRDPRDASAMGQTNGAMPGANSGLDMALHPAVQAAVQLQPTIAEAADEVESTGRLPDPIVAALTETGLYHLYLPTTAGGPEVDPMTGLLAIEALAQADASVAWCAHVSSANAWQLATLAPGTVADMAAATGHGWRMSGSARPLGRATRVEGGFVVNGQWDFASNCNHAGWYCGTCIVEEDGRRRARAMFMPIGDGTIVDTWHVAGLRGTGSHDFRAVDVFVPDERVSAGRHVAAQPGRLYRQRLTMAVNWALTAGVSLGTARGALDCFSALSSNATAGTTDVALRDRGEVQTAVGRAEAKLGAARAYCLASLGALWQAGDDDDIDDLLCAARLAIPHAMHTAVEVVDLLFAVGGTRSVFTRHQLERRFRDAHVAVQHGAGSVSHFQAGGRVSLGLPAGAPFW